MPARRLMAVGAALFICQANGRAADPATSEPAAVGGSLPTVGEAKERARLIHASLRGALEVMHRDFFRRGESKAIPSESLQDVFKALAGRFGVTIRWLATEETVMNVEHKAGDAFGRQALKAVGEGSEEFSAVEDGRLRFAGSIVLENQCLKCHVANRTSLEDRFAALEISLPVKAETPTTTP
jgi:hypothetical protein